MHTYQTSSSSFVPINCTPLSVHLFPSKRLSEVLNLAVGRIPPVLDTRNPGTSMLRHWRGSVGCQLDFQYSGSRGEYQKPQPKETRKTTCMTSECLSFISTFSLRSGPVQHNPTAKQIICGLSQRPFLEEPGTAKSPNPIVKI